MERVPVELWTSILEYALYTPGLASGYFIRQQQHDGNEERTRSEQVRQSLRAVCRNWQRFVDSFTGGWLNVDQNGHTTEVQTRRATRIDVRNGRQFVFPAVCDTRILSVNTPTVCIDSFLATHGTCFPFVQVLDLRPASSILRLHAGVSATTEFFPRLANLFPRLSTLSITLPAALPTTAATPLQPDLVTFPNLTHLSYHVDGTARLSDTRRCDRIADWSLPILSHLEIRPIASTRDWQLVKAGISSWGRALTSFFWDAEYPDQTGIEITKDDVALLSRIERVHPGKTTTRLSLNKSVPLTDQSGFTWRPNSVRVH
ncbi:hypothetical protein FRC19_011978 [Serendipita sp. 401]|nr:hypothetical protein FRC19_011978 [Serendipita sp. 401]